MITNKSNYQLSITLLLATSIITYQLLLMTAPSAQAQDQRVLEIRPPILELSADPGQTLEEKVTIKNLADRSISLEFLRRDFIAAGEAGEPQILDEGQVSPYSLLSWIATNRTTLDLAPGSEALVLITIRVPQDAEPGGHYGLVAYTESGERGGGGVAIQPGIGTLMLVRVSGDIVESGQIESFKSQKSFTTVQEVPFALRFRNSGNVHLKPTGVISVTNLFGREVANLKVNEKGASVLPQSTRLYEADWRPRFAFGKYRAQLFMRTTEQADITASSPVTFWIMPLREIVMGGLIVLILVMTILQYNAMIAARARRKR